MLRRQRDYWHQAAVTAAEAAHRNIWSAAELRELQRSLVQDRVIPASTTLDALTSVLIERGQLRDVELRPVSHPGQGGHGKVRLPKQRLVWGSPSAFEVALSLRPRSYLSHGSAVAIHGLISAGGQRVYVNQEQSPKPAPSGRLEQGAIDRAFANKARTSTYSFEYGDTEIVLVNGKHTNDYGVTEISTADGQLLRVTGLARTLVDIVVRPAYAGGPATVLSAYRAGVGQFATNDLSALVAEIGATLDALGHLYPYHQAVGFYLHRSEVSDEMIRPLRARGLAFDFYLENAMQGTAYDPHWRVHYPKTLT